MSDFRYVRPTRLPFLDGDEPCGVCGCPRSVHLPDGPLFYGNGAPIPGGKPYYRAHCDICLKLNLAREDWLEREVERTWLHDFAARV